MKSVLVFGLSGFIGSSIKKFLSKYKVYAYANNQQISKTKNIYPVNFDLDNKKKISQFKNRISYVINLSWYGIPDFSTKNNNFNIKLNKSIIDFSKNINAKKVFISGSCFEYDDKKIKLHEQSSITKKCPRSYKIKYKKIC